MTETVKEILLDQMQEDFHPGNLVFPGHGGVKQKSVSKAFLGQWTNWLVDIKSKITQYFVVLPLMTGSSSLLC